MELLIQIILWIIGGIVAMWLMKELFMASFSHVKTGNITEKLFVIKSNYVNFYIYKTEEFLISFDAGYKVKSIEKELSKVNIKPEEITHVFLTHTDMDHVGGLKLFKNAQIYFSVDEEQMINGKTSRFPLLKNKKINDYQLLSDGEEVVIGEPKPIIYNL